MRELNVSELEVVSGGADWTQVGVGVGSVAVAIAIVSNPVGLVGLAAATAFAYFGGVVIGDGLVEGDVFDGTKYRDGTEYR